MSKEEQISNIDIPFDQLNIFAALQEDPYQEILTETLLVSTLGCLHESKHNHKVKVFVTGKSCWFLKNIKRKWVVPNSSIRGIVKGKDHPQLVILTQQDHDNIRLSASSIERIWYIISAISYQFTYIQERQLTLMTVNCGDLRYFERSSEQKKTNKNINLQKHPKQMLTYRKPFKNMMNIYGHFRNNQKVILEKQLQVQNVEGDGEHLAYVARIIDQSSGTGMGLQKFTESEYEHEDRYICHYVDKKQEYLQQLYEHKGLEFIQELIYVRAIDYKIQIFFQFGSSLRGHSITPPIFKQIWKLYDLAKQIDKQCLITTDSFVVIEVGGKVIGEQVRVVRKTSEQKSHEVQEQNERLWREGKHKLVLKEFRYDFLLEAVEWNRFIYDDHEADDEKLGEPKDEQITTRSSDKREQDIEEEEAKTALRGKVLRRNAFLQKTYTIGQILYQLCTGQNLFSYHLSLNPFEGCESYLQDEMIFLITMKQMLKERRIQIFPKYLKIKSLDLAYRSFIEKCLLSEFESEEELFDHSWLNIKRKQQGIKK